MSLSSRLTDLNPDWLDRALAERGSGTAPVLGLDVQPVTFMGATTEMARLHITYADTGVPGPPTLVAKLRGTSEVQRQMDLAMGLFAREACFYGTFADAVPVRTPRCWSIGDGDAGPLLLEDLGDLRMCDQMDGMNLPDAETMMDALADLHATFWESDQLTEPWLASPAEGVFAGMIGQLVASGAPALAERYGDQVPADVMSAILDRSHCWTDVLARLVEGPQTLIHNDARLDNLFFGDEGTPCLIDWQLVGRSRGTQDVGYLLAGNMDGDELSARWEPLLRRYHDRLVALGVSGYSFDQCVEHYRQSIVYPLGAGMALLGDMDVGDGRGLGDRIVTRCLRHIAELESFKVL
ncbi:MAG: hypothetical protein JWR52_2239 [Marmoricola sp.]|nr:hypothetical protein [Marmoricola sp.]